MLPIVIIFASWALVIPCVIIYVADVGVLARIKRLTDSPKRADARRLATFQDLTARYGAARALVIGGRKVKISGHNANPDLDWLGTQFDLLANALDMPSPARAYLDCGCNTCVKRYLGLTL